MKTIKEIFENYEGPLLNKWDNYIDIYDSYFSKYRGSDFVFLEIGISHGGSLKFWREYFGEKALIIGVDVNPDCKRFEDENTRIFIGSQQDEIFLKELKATIPRIDVLLDDGGHTMLQQITTFNILYDHVKDDGIYMCEDTCTSYWKTYGGGLRRKGSYIETTKKHIDQLNGWFANGTSQTKKMNTTITETTLAIHYYTSVIVYIKKRMHKPKNIFKGFETVNHEKFAKYGRKVSAIKRITNLIRGRHQY